jgi:hypothetical protein
MNEQFQVLYRVTESMNTNSGQLKSILFDGATVSCSELRQADDITYGTWVWGQLSR